MISGFVFDLDGTLFDTEKMLVRYWHEAGEMYGYDIKKEHVNAIRSTDSHEAESIFKEFFGNDFDYIKVRDKRRELMNADISKNGVPLKPGAREILEFAHERHIKSAIATATDRSRTEWYLEKNNIRHLIDAIVTTADVPRGKPSPDIYIVASGSVDCRPQNVCAFEDSPNGVESAASAGCFTIMIPDESEADEKSAKLASAVCKSFFEAIDLIKDEVRADEA